MIAEIRRLEPKPGRAFGDPPGAPAIPDVYRHRRRRTSAGASSSTARRCRACWSTRSMPPTSGAARSGRRTNNMSRPNFSRRNWLTKSLEQRARTILNVASEIVRRQDAFLVEGVSGLRPLNLKMVGEAIGVHESTVSRATAHKFIQTPRGLFEMKYFFTAAIASSEPGEAHSAEAVRQRIRQMIDGEDPREVLSDDVHRRAPAQGGHRRRPAHRRQISRQPQNPLVGRAAQDEDGADARPASNARIPWRSRPKSIFRCKLNGVAPTIDIGRRRLLTLPAIRAPRDWPRRSGTGQAGTRAVAARTSGERRFARLARKERPAFDDFEGIRQEPRHRGIFASACPGKSRGDRSRDTSSARSAVTS